MDGKTFKKLLDVYVSIVSYNAAALDGVPFDEEERLLKEVIDYICDSHSTEKEQHETNA